MRRVFILLLALLFLPGCAKTEVPASTGQLTVFSDDGSTTTPQTVAQETVEAIMTAIRLSEQGSADSHPALTATHMLKFTQNSDEITVYFDQTRKTATIGQIRRGKTVFTAYRDVNIDLSGYAFTAESPVYEPAPELSQLALRARVTPEQLAQIGEKIPYELVPATGYTYRLEKNAQALAMPSFADESETATATETTPETTPETAQTAIEPVWFITAPSRIDKVERAGSALRLTLQAGNASTIQIRESDLAGVTAVVFVSADDIYVIDAK